MKLLFFRYFKRNELKELFILENPKESITYGLLNELRGRQTVNSTMENHFKFLKSLGTFTSIKSCSFLGDANST